MQKLLIWRQILSKFGRRIVRCWWAETEPNLWPNFFRRNRTSAISSFQQCGHWVLSTQGISSIRKELHAGRWSSFADLKFQTVMSSYIYREKNVFLKYQRDCYIQEVIVRLVALKFGRLCAGMKTAEL